MPLTGEVVLPVGIEHREGRGQFLVGLMMVDDDDFGPTLVGCLDGGAGGSAAINGDDERRSLLRKPGEGRRRRAIAFGGTVGDVGRRYLTVGAQEALDQRH